MIEWWNSLNALTQIFFCVAIPSTLVLIIQTILTFIGIGAESDFDTDAEIETPEGMSSDVGDGVFDSDTELDCESIDSGMDSLKLFTFRGIVAFLVIFGWVGVAMDSSGAPVWLTVPIALISGFVMMLSLALIMRMVMKLRNDGTADNRNAIGTAGRVHLTVPPSRSGEGKVHVMLQGAYVERDAVTDEEEAIPTGSEIVVVGVSGQTSLVVKRK